MNDLSVGNLFQSGQSVPYSEKDTLKNDPDSTVPFGELMGQIIQADSSLNQDRAAVSSEKPVNTEFSDDVSNAPLNKTDVSASVKEKSIVQSDTSVQGKTMSHDTQSARQTIDAVLGNGNSEHLSLMGRKIGKMNLLAESLNFLGGKQTFLPSSVDTVQGKIKQLLNQFAAKKIDPHSSSLAKPEFALKQSGLKGEAAEKIVNKLTSSAKSQLAGMVFESKLVKPKTQPGRVITGMPKGTAVRMDNAASIAKALNSGSVKSDLNVTTDKSALNLKTNTQVVARKNTVSERSDKKVNVQGREIPVKSKFKKGLSLKGKISRAEMTGAKNSQNNQNVHEQVSVKDAGVKHNQFVQTKSADSRELTVQSQKAQISNELSQKNNVKVRLVQLNKGSGDSQADAVERLIDRMSARHQEGGFSQALRGLKSSDASFQAVFKSLLKGLSEARAKKPLNRAMIEIDPPSLGKIEVKLTYFSDSRVDVHVRSENTAVKEMLENSFNSMSFSEGEKGRESSDGKKSGHYYNSSVEELDGYSVDGIFENIQDSFNGEQAINVVV